MSLSAAILICILAAQGKTEEIEIVNGAFFNQLNSPTFYSSFIPIIHEYVTPQWRDDDLRLKWRSGHASVCNTTSEGANAWANAGCPSVYYYNSILTTFHAKTQWKKPSMESNGTASSESAIAQSRFSCDEISTHFIGPHIISKDWSKYWETLTNCPIGESVQLRSSTKYSTIDLSKLNMMLDTYYTQWAVKISSYENLATYTNAYSAYQAMAVLIHSVEMDRWRDAVTECESNRLPRPLVDESTWKAALTSAINKVTKKQFRLSVTEPNSYYSLPLSDCIFAKDNDSYVIRTLVPLISSRSAFKLIELKSIPFSYEFNSSSDTNFIRTLRGIGGRYIIDEVSNTIVSKTECKSLELCFIPEKGSLPIVDPCVAAVFANQSEIIKKLCKSRCIQIPTNNFPFFSRLASDKYATAGSSGSKLEIFLNCHAIPYKVISPNDTGALEITLPCHCKIVHQSIELHSYQPCGDKLVMRLVAPLVHDKELIDIDIRNTDTTDLESFRTNVFEWTNNNHNAILSHSEELEEFKQKITALWVVNLICFSVIFFLILIGLVMIWKLTQVRSSNFQERVAFQNTQKECHDPILLLH